MTNFRMRMPTTLLLPVLVVVLASRATLATADTIRQEIKAMAGGAVSLRCAVNHAACGDFHSIKWYKENRRVFVYSPVVEFSKAEGELLERSSLDVDNREARLNISPIQTSDEGEYKCEITFLDISKNCPVVQLVKLTTLAAPKYVNLSLSTGAGTRPLLSNSIVGPFNQGSEIRLICTSGGGKPIPQVTWYSEGRPVSGRVSSSEDPDRTGTGRSEITLKVGRQQLGAKLECRSTNEAVESPLSTSVQLDVSLRPDKVKISGGSGVYREESEVKLSCLAGGARPAAVLTWYNGTSLYPHQPAGQVELQDDGTYSTASTLVFPASRFEDNRKMICEARNEVVEYYEEEPLRADTRLEVEYPPVVSTSPASITVNVSSQVIIQCAHSSNPAKLNKVAWYVDGELVNVRERVRVEGGQARARLEGGKARPRYEGGTVDQPSLTILQADRKDAGSYTCVLDNEIGSGRSERGSKLSVHYPPTVAIRMEPHTTVSETEHRDVTLHCDLVEGNPSQLTGVVWFMNNKLLKELPQCKGREDLCDVDPSRLLLEGVTRQSHANYSCIGMNEAGESEMSPAEELTVYYPPGNATIITDSETVTKGGRLTLTCLVSEPGRPAATEFIWRRGGHQLRGVTSSTWLVEPVTLETQSQISCQAKNEVGLGTVDVLSIQVEAPPAFIESLKPYTGFTSSSRNVSLTCSVECSPLCQIIWFKDGMPLKKNSDKYSVNTRQVPPNYSKNDFESVRSTLTWNLGNFPAGQLNRDQDNANFSCRSTDTSAGPGVSSDTHFRVEYSPDNLYISQEEVEVREGDTPERIVCGAQAYPEASYMWRFNDQIIQTHNVLYFGGPVSRDQAGTYVCEAQNRHGTAYSSTRLNVQYKPECEIFQEKDEEEIVLTCKASSNPSQVSFVWRRENESWAESTAAAAVQTSEMASTIRIPLASENLGTYLCFVNNTVGLGAPCEIDLQGIGVLKNISDTNVIVIVAVIAAALVAAISLGIIIFLCRRRGGGDKAERKDGSVLGAADIPSTNAAATVPQPVHKWPLRPGVHVHVNGLNTLTGGTNAKINHQINGFSYGAKTSRSSSSSGSDWASNASSNQELNSESAKGGKNISKVDQQQQQQLVDAASSSGSSRPSSRQKKRRGETNKHFQNNNQADQLLPTFYENVPYHQKQKLDRGRSESPADRLGDQDSCMERLGRPEDRLGRLEGGVGPLLPPSRPRSQLSNTGIYGFGSVRSSKRSRHSPSPCNIHSAPGTSIASMCTTGRGPGPHRYSTLHTPGYSNPPLDLAEAEVESDPDLPHALPQERNLLIEYSTHVPSYMYSQDTPILTSLACQSLPQSRHYPNQYPEQSRPDQAIYNPPPLSEPISPPKQFDSSPLPQKPGREGGY